MSNRVIKKWSEEEINWLKINYKNLKIDKEVFVEKLQRTWKAISYKASQELLLNRKYEWTEDKLNYLKENYGNTKTSKLEITNYLNTKWSLINNKANF